MVASTLRQHWPEYLIEGWALGTFMVSAGVFAILTDYPGSPLLEWLPEPGLRRLLGGVAMGLTLLALVYSPWGRRSGAHMNPAVTLTFLRLGKIAPPDALYYIAAQFAGGLLGVLLVASLFGAAFTAEPVRYAATLPRPGGTGIAFLLEVLISFGLMLTILVFSNRERLMALTGTAAGLLLVVYITFESPFSGMSMNPARSFASAAPQRLWGELWLYFTAPLLGMLAAAECYTRIAGRDEVHCAKLFHADDVRCIHCGYEPGPSPGSSPPERPRAFAMPVSEEHYRD